MVHRSLTISDIGFATSVQYIFKTMCTVIMELVIIMNFLLREPTYMCKDT